MICGTPLRSAVLDSLDRKNGVSIARSPGSSVAESLYLAVRRAENRVYDDSEVERLPYLEDHQHAAEWKLRARSFQRIHHYFTQKGRGIVLDLGCGNGWFAGRLSDIAGLCVVGLDVNLTELEQAARLFSQESVNFVYGDVFSLGLPPASFDLITLGASVQYFPDLDELLQRLLGLLVEGGEIHVFDSPLYAESEVEAARQRSLSYYTRLGFPQMADHYFHHGLNRLESYCPDFLYRPRKRGLWERLSGTRDVPFPWIRIGKPNKRHRR